MARPLCWTIAILCGMCMGITVFPGCAFLTQRRAVGDDDTVSCTGVSCRSGFNCHLKSGKAYCCGDFDCCEDVSDVDSSCSFVDKATTCSVTLSSYEVCPSNPCPASEYCKVYPCQTRCCRQELVFDPATGKSTCSEHCILPPANFPRSPLPSCPGSSRTLSKTDPIITLPPFDPFAKDTSRTSPPTVGEKKDRCSTTETPTSENPTLKESKKIITCSFTHNSCPVTLDASELCTTNLCGATEYCKVVEDNVRCCRQELFLDIDPSTFALVDRCREHCTLPPKDPPIPPLPPCPNRSVPNRLSTTAAPTFAPFDPFKQDETTEKPQVDDTTTATGCPTTEVIPSTQPTTAEVIPSTQPTPTESPCPNTTVFLSRGAVKINITEGIVGYRCRKRYRLTGNNTGHCAGGLVHVQGRRPKCHRVRTFDNRCFISHDDCTGCLSIEAVCKDEERPDCPPRNFCKRVGPQKKPTCCFLSEDSFGRCTESCASVV